MCRPLIEMNAQEKQWYQILMKLHSATFPREGVFPPGMSFLTILLVGVKSNTFHKIRFINCCGAGGIFFSVFKSTLVKHLKTLRANVKYLSIL